MTTRLVNLDHQIQYVPAAPKPPKLPGNLRFVHHAFNAPKQMQLSGNRVNNDDDFLMIDKGAFSTSMFEAPSEARASSEGRHPTEHHANNLYAEQAPRRLATEAQDIAGFPISNGSVCSPVKGIECSTEVPSMQPSGTSCEIQTSFSIQSSRTTSPVPPSACGIDHTHSATSDEAQSTTGLRVPSNIHDDRDTDGSPCDTEEPLEDGAFVVEDAFPDTSDLIPLQQPLPDIAAEDLGDVCRISPPRSMVKDVKIVVPRSRPSEAGNNGEFTIKKTTHSRKCRTPLQSRSPRVSPGYIEEDHDMLSSDDEKAQFLRSSTDIENEEDSDYCGNEEGDDDDDDRMTNSSEFYTNNRSRKRAFSKSRDAGTSPETSRVRELRRPKPHHSTTNVTLPMSQSSTPPPYDQIDHVVERIPIQGYLIFRENSDGNITYRIDFERGSSTSPTLRTDDLVREQSGPSSHPRNQARLATRVQGQSSNKSEGKGTPWSAEEERTMKRLKAQGLPWKEIAHYSPGRTPGALAVRYSTKYAAPRVVTPRRRK